MFANDEMGLFKRQVYLQDTNEIMLCIKLISVVRQSFPPHPVSGDLIIGALQAK